MRIAIDAMGGDEAPAGIIGGALVAARHLQVGLLLVGARSAIERELSRHPGASWLDIEIADTPERIEMAEPAAAALRPQPARPVPPAEHDLRLRLSARRNRRAPATR